MSAPNTSLPPRYDIADPTRNWVYRGTGANRVPFSFSPYAMVLQAQRMLGVPPNGVIDTTTANALRADLRSQWSFAPASYVQEIDAAISNGRVNATLWTLLVAKALTTPYSSLPAGEIALGTNAQLPQVIFPMWNSRVPGDDLALVGGANAGSDLAQFYQRNRTAILVGGAVLLVSGIAAAYFLTKDDGA